MKLFISSDIEGTAGIVDWKETEPGDRYGYFCGQMSKEVAAACEGALEAGVERILVKDAHDSARNIDPSMLPKEAQVLRGWVGGPASMMAGLDGSFDAAAMTGYHSPAACDGNPLSHTMTLQIEKITLNGMICSEFMLNAYFAAYCGVPVIFVSGDEQLCQLAKEICPGITAIPTSRGLHGASIGLHPEAAQECIRAGMEYAVVRWQQQMELEGKSDCLIVLPEYFELEVTYREHKRAYRASFFPGVTQIGPKTVKMESDDYMDILKFMLFV